MLLALFINHNSIHRHLYRSDQIRYEPDNHLRKVWIVQIRGQTHNVIYVEDLVHLRRHHEEHAVGSVVDILHNRSKPRNGINTIQLLDFKLRPMFLDLHNIDLVLRLELTVAVQGFVLRVRVTVRCWAQTLLDVLVVVVVGGIATFVIAAGGVFIG